MAAGCGPWAATVPNLSGKQLPVIELISLHLQSSAFCSIWLLGTECSVLEEDPKSPLWGWVSGQSILWADLLSLAKLSLVPQVAQEPSGFRSHPWLQLQLCLPWPEATGVALLPVAGSASSSGPHLRPLTPS